MFYGFFTQLNHLKLFVRIFIRTSWLCCALIFSIFFVANEDFDTIIAKIGTTTPGNSRWLCWLLTPLPNKTVVFIFGGEYVVLLPFLSKSNFHSFRYIVLVFSNFSIVNLFIWFFFSGIDYCLSSACPLLSTCKNLASTYECVCPKGYILSGNQCQGKTND